MAAGELGVMRAMQRTIFRENNAHSSR
jgi:hypothetical protein